jgi:hypothetical protein
MLARERRIANACQLLKRRRIQGHKLQTCLSDLAGQSSSAPSQWNAIGFTPSSNDDVHRRDVPDQVATDRFTQMALEPVSLHVGVSVFRNDEPNTGMMQKGSDSPELEMLGQDALPIARHRVKVGSPGQPIRAWKAKINQAPAYLVGSLTVSLFRPFFRLRLNTSRPHRVDIRVRNPCVRIRRLLRGRYVGLPITSSED